MMHKEMTAQDHRAAAKAAREEQQASFERVDTDGFLTQWAGGLTADKHDAEARLLENGGLMEDVALFFNGKLASTHQGFGQYGEYWVLNDEAAEAYGKRFFSPSKAQNGPIARDRAKGFTYGHILVKGYVTTKGADGATGLSGALTVRVGTFPVVEDLKAGNFEVTSTDGAFDHLDEKGADQ